MAMVTVSEMRPVYGARQLGKPRRVFPLHVRDLESGGLPRREPLNAGLRGAAPEPRRAEARSDVARSLEVLRDLLETVARPTSPCCLLALDSEGVCVAAWDLGMGPLEQLARADVRPGYSLAEFFVGPSGVGALTTRQTRIVRGDAHALPALKPFVTTGAVVLDATTGRTPACLLVVSDGAAEVEWVESLTAAIESELCRRARSNEHALMQRYLEERSDSRHAVVALNEQIIITNAAAARMVGVEEQSRLWEYAQRVVQGGAEAVATLDVGRGSALQVHCEPVLSHGTTVGVLMRWRRPTQTSTTPQNDTALAGLAGSGTKWQTMKRRLAAASGASVLLVGESGSGRSVIARSTAAGGPFVEIDFAVADGLTSSDHARRIRAAAMRGDSVLLLHLEELDTAATDDLARLIQKLPSTIRVLGTIDVHHSNEVGREAILDSFGAVVTVPPLRERLEDIPELVRAITANLVAENPQLDGVQWMTDALQTLTRLEWPRNISTLESIVRGVLGQVRTGYITARDLPAGIGSRASGRQLNALERIEAHAILQAIKDADGNKLIAADSLGIARSTLYRKLRGFGIDLSASTF